MTVPLNQLAEHLQRLSEHFDSGLPYEAGKSTAYGNAAELLEEALKTRCRQPDCLLPLNHDDGVHTLDRVQVRR